MAIYSSIDNALRFLMVQYYCPYSHTWG